MLDILAFILNLVRQLYDVPTLIAWGGYTLIAFMVFAETGLFFGFFLPGDSLLITAGLLAATGLLDLLTLNLLLVPAAVLGDAVGYAFGAKVGKRLYSRPDSRFFKHEHLETAQAFYDKHGGKTIIFARFVPIVRTFAPIIAGTAGMPYPKFFSFNVIGGLLWVTGMLLLGYFLGRAIPNLENNLLPLVLLIIVISFLPALREWAKKYFPKANEAK